MSLKRYTSAQNMPILCQQKELYMCRICGKLLRDQVQEKKKMSDGTVEELESHDQKAL